jgi:dienelactone hydrolase
MTTTLLVDGSLGQVAPGAVTLANAGELGIASAIPNLTSQIAALASFVPAPISFAQQLATAEQTVSGIQAAIATGLPIPSLDDQLALVAAQLAALQAAMQLVQLQVDAINLIASGFSVGGLVAYGFDGATAAFGTELDGAVAAHGSPTGATKAVVVFATTPAALDALSLILVVP